MNPPQKYTAHDLGGAPGFGVVDRGRTAQFAHEWEASVFAMTLACGMLGRWNLDQSRYARERMEPRHYLASSYYEHWLHGLELLLVERGLVSDAELRGGRAAGAGPVAAVAAERVADILAKGAPTLLPADAAPRFAVGAPVRVRTAVPATHTRAPGYTRGRAGVVATHHGAHVFPDRHAARGEKQPRHLYSVRFEGRELWGARGAENPAVYVDLFEPYLEAADAQT